MHGFKALESGDLMRRVAVKYNDEFGDVARGFNDMVDQLQKTTVSRDSLERSEESLRGAVVKFNHEITEHVWRCSVIARSCAAAT